MYNPISRFEKNKTERSEANSSGERGEAERANINSSNLLQINNSVFCKRDKSYSCRQ